MRKGFGRELPEVRKTSKAMKSRAFYYAQGRISFLFSSFSSPSSSFLISHPPLRSPSSLFLLDSTYTIFFFFLRGLSGKTETREENINLKKNVAHFLFRGPTEINKINRKFLFINIKIVIINIRHQKHGFYVLLYQIYFLIRRQYLLKARKNLHNANNQKAQCFGNLKNEP